MIVEMARAAADAEKASAHDLLTRARLAMAAVDHYDQERVD